MLWQQKHELHVPSPDLMRHHVYTWLCEHRQLHLLLGWVLLEHHHKVNGISLECLDPQETHTPPLLITVAASNQAWFSLKFFLENDTVALLFLFDKHCPIM